MFCLHTRPSRERGGPANLSSLVKAPQNRRCRRALHESARVTRMFCWHTSPSHERRRPANLFALVKALQNNETRSVFDSAEKRSTSRCKSACFFVCAHDHLANKEETVRPRIIFFSPASRPRSSKDLSSRQTRSPTLLFFWDATGARVPVPPHMVSGRGEGHQIKTCNFPSFFTPCCAATLYVCSSCIVSRVPPTFFLLFFFIRTRQSCRRPNRPRQRKRPRTVRV
jgi:hypothetical protein